MCEAEWKSHDFSAMAVAWNNDIFVSIADAVKPGTQLEPILFFDKVT